MATRSEEHLYCPVCTEVFRNPVVLSCSHSFCKDCLQSWWKEKPTRECPVCKRRSTKEEPPCNLVLKNLCEAFLLERDQRSSKDLCSLHAEKLKLFCLDHQEPVCLICRDSEMHSEHRFRPIDEAARQQKKNLQDTLQPLKEKIKVLKEVKVKFDRTSEYIEVQARLTEGQIKNEFQKLHQFLLEEEEARLRALREEEQQKSHRMRKYLEALSKEMVALSNTVRDTEDQLMTGDVSFLRVYKVAVERVQQRTLVKDPQLPKRALIDQAKHLGNLGFNIWNKMKHTVSYTRIILDPNTAGPDLILSDDLTSARAEEKQKVHNPERVEGAPMSVLGSEGFSSGSHSWIVYIHDSTEWSVGVLAESAWKQGEVSCGFWGIILSEGEYTARSPSSSIAITDCLSVSEYLKPWMIAVMLDLDKGELSFVNADLNANMYTFTNTFTDRMFPYFAINDKLRLLPGHVSVTVR